MTRALNQGDMLQWYRIDRVLGRGGFGITYLATDTNLDHLVAIKEYAPDAQVARSADNSLDPISRDVSESYDVGLGRFIKEARTLVKFNHPSIVRIITVFEANNTAYLVMDYEEGEVFKDYTARVGLIPETRLKDIFLRVIDGLAQVHDRGFLHRDIKPANLIIRKDGNPVLLDFGCARPALLGNNTAHTAFVSVGYSPLEQFHSVPGMEEGPWTDIYSLSATMHYAISRQTPPNSASRLAALSAQLSDPLTPATEIGRGHYSEAFLDAIDWGMSPNLSDRPATLAQWREALTAHVAPSEDGRTVVVARNPVADSIRAAESQSARQTARPSRMANPRTERNRRDSTRLREAPQQETFRPDDAPWDDLQLEVHTERVSPEPRQTRPVIIALSLVAGLAVVGLGGWYFLSPQPDALVNNGEQSAIQDLVASDTDLEPDRGDRADQLVSKQVGSEQLDPIRKSIELGNLVQARQAVTTLQDQGYQSSVLDELAGELGTAEQHQLAISDAERAIAAGEYGKASSGLEAIGEQSVFSERVDALREEINVARAADAVKLEQLQARLAAEREAKEKEQQVLAQKIREAGESIDAAEQALSRGDAAEARSSIDQLRELDPENNQLDALEQKLVAVVSDDQNLLRAEQLLDAGDFKESRRLLDGVKRTSVNTSRIASMQARISSAQGRNSELAAALKLAGQNREKQLWSDAAANYEKALSLDPNNSQAQQALGSLKAEWLEYIESRIGRAGNSSVERSITEFESRFGQTADTRSLAARVDDIQRSQRKFNQQLRSVEQLIGDAKYDLALGTLDEIKAQSGQSSQTKALRREALAGLQAQRQQREKANERRKLASEKAARERQAAAQKKAEKAAAEQAALLPPAYDSDLKEAEKLLASSDLTGAERALGNARALGAPASRLDALQQRYEELLSARSVTLTDQHVFQAKQQFEQLAQAVVNRNLRVVNQLTKTNQEKLDLVRALVGKAAKMSVKIKDVVPDSQSKSISAVLELQDMVLPNGQTYIPATVYREHPIRVELAPSGWSKIIW